MNNSFERMCYYFAIDKEFFLSAPDEDTLYQASFTEEEANEFFKAMGLNAKDFIL